jgi:hypothetical protein
MTTVRRTGSPKIGERKGLVTLSQRFLFERTSVEQLIKTIWARPLVGDGSIFGHMAREGQDTPKGRLARDFRPAPTFCFDVRIRREGDAMFMVNFSQPGREVPYLEGDALWSLYDSPTGEGALLVEHINDATALDKRCLPLTGKKPSLRRWLFFKFGHANAMDNIMKRIAAFI